MTLNVAAISQQARQVKPGRVLAAVVVAPPYLVGWLLAKAALVVWLVLAHVGVAFSAGWRGALKNGGGGPAR